MRGLAAVALVAASCATLPANPSLPTGPVSLRVQTVDEEVLTLGSLRGKVVLVTIINTWADPALAEIPLLRRLSQVHAPDLAIVCIALDAFEDAVQIFAETFELPYPVGKVEDPATFVSARGPFGPIGTVPTSVLLDRSGVIAARMDGTWEPDVLRRAIEGLLAADPATH